MILLFIFSKYENEYLYQFFVGDTWNQNFDTLYIDKFPGSNNGFITFITS